MDVSHYLFFFRRKQLSDNIFIECGARLNQKSILCVVGPEPLTGRSFEEEAGKEIVPEEKQSTFDFFGFYPFYRVFVPVY
ncbi:hypothetical protein ACSAZL_13780 [Methanosarcina sp. T3]|uniref:hypothetical protein n=1 Tax=Methanosarcina sp. T3 TaxID=3439062 RepID=UPI003F82E510